MRRPRCRGPPLPRGGPQDARCVLELMSRPVPTAGAKVQRGRPKNRNRPGPKYELIDLLAGATGLEPAASGVTGRRSNQLSYAPAGNTGAGSPTPPAGDCQANPSGIEPSDAARKPCPYGTSTSSSRR